MRLLCPAKINLHLRVGRRRADGFHPLLTWMTTVGLFDRLTVDPLPQLPGDDPAQRERQGHPPGRERAGEARILLLSSDLPGLPTDESNLIVRSASVFATAIAGSSGAGETTGAAARLSGYAAHTGAESSSEVLPQAAPHLAPQGRREGPRRGEGEATRIARVHAVLEKKIPLGAGLGGGSSDAARTLAALNRLWQIDWPVERLAPVAAQLGSDVPFFLHGPSSICTGRGDIVRPIQPPRHIAAALLVLPEIHLPTAAVYRRFDEMGLGFDEHLDSEPDWQQWTDLGAKDLLGGLVNDLEGPAFDICPELGTLRSRVEMVLKRVVRMSGSGSSLFTLYEDAREAESAAVEAAAHCAVRAIAIPLAPQLSDDLGAPNVGK